jgi:hypothetical protein
MGSGTSVRLWIVALVALVAALAASAGGWLAGSSPGTAIIAETLAEQSQVASLTKSVETLAGEASAAATPPVAKSFTTLAYVTKVSGPAAGKFTVSIDPFTYLEGAAATDYAVAHGMTPPSNGLLLVNESTKATAYPLAATAKITAYSGGVESMTPQVITPALLKQWVADHTALPEAVSDMWRVTVKSGTITTIQMIAVAD